MKGLEHVCYVVVDRRHQDAVDKIFSAFYMGFGLSRRDAIMRYESQYNREFDRKKHVTRPVRVYVSVDD